VFTGVCMKLISGTQVVLLVHCNIDKQDKSSALFRLSLMQSLSDLTRSRDVSYCNFFHLLCVAHALTTFI